MRVPLKKFSLYQRNLFKESLPKSNAMDAKIAAAALQQDKMAQEMTRPMTR